MIKRLLLALLFSGGTIWTLVPALGQGESDSEPIPQEAPAPPAPPVEDNSYADVLKLNADGLRPEVQLYNLAVVDAQRGRTALATARLRQSLHLRPTFIEARQALEWLSNTPPSTSFEKLRKWLWLYQPPWAYPLGALVTLFVGLWLLLGWIERFRQNRAQDLDRPPIPPSMPTLLALGLAFISVWILKSWDRNFIERATFLGESGFKASPSEGAPEIAPLRAGTELVLERTHEGWVLARQPGGATGWVLQDELYKTTEPPTPEDLSKH